MKPWDRRDLFKNAWPGGGAVLAGQATRNSAFGGTSSPAVETEDGKLRGVSAGGVTMFKSASYRGPVDGAGSFMPPSKPAKWAGIRDCTKPAPRCVQGRSGQPQFQFLRNP